MLNWLAVRPTPFGPVVLLWSAFDGSPKIVRVLLSRPGAPADDHVGGLYPDSRPFSCPEIRAVAADIRAFLSGQDVVFPLGLVALETRTDFQQAVLRAEHGIPRGRVSTYRLIARRLGQARAARAVGNALAANPFPIIVPCHRAVRSDRVLGGFQGGTAMKRALLEQEGITFDPSGHVIARRFHYS
jgi:methylated-DNA-[protein]-cysteine S-methyltransferase